MKNEYLSEYSKAHSKDGSRGKVTQTVGGFSGPDQ